MEVKIDACGRCASRLNGDGTCPNCMDRPLPTEITGIGPDAKMTMHKNGGMETVPIGRFDLLPPRATIKLAALFMEKSTTIKGPRKYPKNNWRLIPCRAHVNHAIGHLFAFMAGDTSDDHLTHAASRTMMAMEVKDDRPYDKVGRKK